MENNPINPYISSGTGLATGIINTIYNAWQANKQREWSEKMMDKQNDWSLMMWNKTNEYNDPKNQIARLTNAGLNPLFYGLDGSSANGLESAQPLNYERADSSISNPMDGYIQASLANKQMELMDSEIDKNKADAEGTGLDNEWKKRTMDARVEATELANSLTESNIEKVDKEKDHVAELIKKTIEETKNEVTRGLLMEVEKNLKNAQARQIVELLPYQKLLMSAQTDAENAAAAASWMNVAYNAKLISTGYIDAMAKEMKARARSEEAKAQVDEYIAAVKWGTLYEDKGLGKVSNFIMSGLVDAAEVLKPFFNLFGIALGAKAAGSVLGNGNIKGNKGSQTLEPRRDQLQDVLDAGAKL